MNRFGEFDASPIIEAAKSMRMMTKDFNRFIERFMEKLGDKALEIARSYTPAASGELRDAWEVTSAEWGNGCVEIMLHNPLIYASYVNDGFQSHFVPGHWEGSKFIYNPNDPEGGMFVGEPNTFVPGKFMVEFTMRDIEAMLERAFETDFKVWAKSFGFEVS